VCAAGSAFAGSAPPDFDLHHACGILDSTARKGLEMSERERAVKLFRGMAADYVVEAADAKVASGEAQWVLDPQVEDVVGLVLNGTNRALVVVYLDSQDFECDEERLGLFG
jgi:hypothetical protein